MKMVAKVEFVHDKMIGMEIKDDTRQNTIGRIIEILPENCIAVDISDKDYIDLILKGCNLSIGINVYAKPARKKESGYNESL